MLITSVCLLSWAAGFLQLVRDVQVQVLRQINASIHSTIVCKDVQASSACGKSCLSQLLFCDQQPVGCDINSCLRGEQNSGYNAQNTIPQAAGRRPPTVHRAFCCRTCACR
jgi:hypothetical protein